MNPFLIVLVFDATNLATRFYLPIFSLDRNSRRLLYDRRRRPRTCVQPM